MEHISIHALREEGDENSSKQQEGNTIFLSTPSARRATPAPTIPIFVPPLISIHALREEGDAGKVKVTL